MTGEPMPSKDPPSHHRYILYKKGFEIFKTAANQFTKIYYRNNVHNFVVHIEHEKESFTVTANVWCYKMFNSVDKLVRLLNKMLASLASFR